jgi:hypothetical protein
MFRIARALLWPVLLLILKARHKYELVRPWFDINRRYQLYLSTTDCVHFIWLVLLQGVGYKYALEWPTACFRLHPKLN